MSRRTVRVAARPQQQEARSSVTSDSYAESFGIRQTASGQFVSAFTAENLATVGACVNAVASSLASLPALIYRTVDGDRVEDPTHPVGRLLVAPNEYQTWPDWLEWTMGQVLLHGNSLSVLDIDNAGRVVGLIPIPWSCVSVQMLTSGRLVFDVAPQGTVSTLAGLPAGLGGRTGQRRYLSHEVFLLRDRSDDALLGRSRISRAPDVLGNAQALQQWSGRVWANSARPSAVLEMEKTFPNEPTALRVRNSVERAYSGNDNAGKIAILEAGLTWKSLSLSPQDSEVLASRRFSVEELCRLFNVPPPIVQSYEHNTFTNSQQASLWFAQNTLLPWTVKVAAEFQRSVFGMADRGTHSLELDLSGLMRGDFVARWAAWQAAVSGGILEADEVREAEGWGPRRTKPTPPAGP